MENAATLLIVGQKPIFAQVLAKHLAVTIQHDTVVHTKDNSTALLLLPENAKEAMVMEEAATKTNLPMLMLLPEGLRAEPSCRHLARPLALDTLRKEIDYLLQQPRRLHWENIGYFDPLGLHLHNLFGQSIALTEKEAALLSYLAGQQQSMTAEMLLAALWHYHPASETHTFDTHLYRLRQKLETVFSEKLTISYQNNGYLLCIQ